MKVKVSITLSEELLGAIDRCHRGFNSRSEFLEAAARSYLARPARERAKRSDLGIINRHADSLNAEAADVLTYQATV
jgi:metal-responsive CopG/Arc/MetJ family transcriptional regulator